VVESVVSQDSANRHAYALPAGTMLHEFRVESVLGHGGFGITYLAKDTGSGETVAIKEYLPSELAMRVSNSTVRVRSPDDQKIFNDGVFSFLEEARRITRVVHPNIIVVKKFFTMNGTAYIVLRYEPGQTLKQRLEKPMNEKSVRSMMDGVLQGLVAIHDHDTALLHRDIKPDNIILSRNRSDRELTPVLIDFGAAREFHNRNSRSVTALVSQGYSPPEQYGVGGQQGPWSDLYALGATAYRCVTGTPPPYSLTRLGKDTIVPAAVKARGRYSDDLLRLIDWMMVLKEGDRPRSAREALQSLRNSREPTGPTGGGSETVSGDHPRTLSGGEALRGSGVTVSDDGPQNFVLQFANSPGSETLGMAFKRSPPGLFLGDGGKYQADPHYFKLTLVEGEQGQPGYRGGPELRRRIKRGSRVSLLSEDGSIDTIVSWPLASEASAGIRARSVLLFALPLIAFAAAALNIGPIQDEICAKTNFCTAQQVLFRNAQECVQHASSCSSIDACVGNFRNQATITRLVDRMAAAESGARSACRNADTAAFQSAKTCAEQKAASNICAVEPCYAVYISAQPSGEHVREARSSAASAHQACQTRGAAPEPSQAPQPLPAPQAQANPPRPAAVPPPPPAAPNPPPAAPPASATPAVALPNGTYKAIRTFVDAKSTTDPLSCPPSTELQVTVIGQVIRFENFEANTGINRKWKGNVVPDGKIAFLGSEATPPTANYLTITGKYDSAEIDSKFCGKGYFKILK
jgi:serine/threonine protein kinase